MTAMPVRAQVAATQRWLGLPLVVALCVLALHAVVALVAGTPVLHGMLVDSDSYARLLRIERLVQTGNWWDGRLPQFDAPFGLVMHWTRPFDVIVLALALPLLPFLAVKQALFWAGAIASPVLHAATAALIAWAAPRYTDRAGAIAVVALFIVQPWIYYACQLGDVDHHSLLIALAAAVLCLLLVWFTQRERLRYAILAGLAAALALWTGPGAELIVAIAGASLGLAWILGEPGLARGLVGFALALAGGTLLALVAERPVAQWTAVELDRISLLQLVLVGCLALAAIAVHVADLRLRPARRGTRLAIAVLALAGALVPMAVWFPDFFAGPYSEIDPRVRADFLAHVIEAAPLLTGTMRSVATTVFALGPLVFALPYAAYRARTDGGGRRPGWLLLIVAMVVYGAGALHEIRVLPYAELALVLPWAACALAVGRHLGERLSGAASVLLASLAAAAVIASPALAAAALMPQTRVAPNPSNLCAWRRLGDTLKQDYGAPPGPMAAYIFEGPKIVWETGYHVIAAPYHRDADGIVDLHDLLLSPPAKARTIAARRDLGLIVLCEASPEHAWFARQAAPGSLFRALTSGTPPAWLEAIGASDRRLAGFRVFRVRNLEH